MAENETEKRTKKGKIIYCPWSHDLQIERKRRCQWKTSKCSPTSLTSTRWLKHAAKSIEWMNLNKTRPLQNEKDNKKWKVFLFNHFVEIMLRFFDFSRVSLFAVGLQVPKRVKNISPDVFAVSFAEFSSFVLKNGGMQNDFSKIH